MDRNVFRYAHDEWLRARAVGLVAVTAETGLEETLAALRRYVALSTDGDVAGVHACGGYADDGGRGGRGRGAARRGPAPRRRASPARSGLSPA